VLCLCSILIGLNNTVFAELQTVSGQLMLSVLPENARIIIFYKIISTKILQFIEEILKLVLIGLVQHLGKIT
jgi:hypothetical protein